MWISVVHCWGNLWVPGVLFYTTNISTPLHSALTRILHIWYPIEWNRKDTFSCHLQIIHIFQGILKQKLKIMSEKLLKKIYFRNGANCVRPDVCACQPGYTGTMCQTGDFLFVFVYLCICICICICILLCQPRYTGTSISKIIAISLLPPGVFERGQMYQTICLPMSNRDDGGSMSDRWDFYL